MIEKATVTKLDNGFPPCPKCGGLLRWDSDFMASELGLLDRDDKSQDEVVNCLTCSDCGRELYLESKETGPEFLDMSRY